MGDEKVECNDKKCFRHGNVRVRGMTLTGVVVSARPTRTVIVKRDLVKKIPKYKRYARLHSRIPAHNPPCINAQPGDLVRIGETRRLSKTKSWTVIEIIKRAEEKE
ncbi:30S ribosomal protein S17 [Candidatus Micrarchaeota archaeon]|nr:30S ribosomal protein S17 [Candidatus Micrarchaeota archaeon]